MRAAFVDGPGRVGVRDAGPAAGARAGAGGGGVEKEGDAMVVDMAACGICGSDVEKVFGSYGQPSMRLGHEPAGVVADPGAAGAEAGFSAGDRVFTHHHVPCYECHLCRRGAETMCPRYYETNLSPCGLAERYSVPGWSVRRGGVLALPDGMPFEEAAMIEPLACCVRAWSRAPAGGGDTAAVWGMGATGMMHAMLARHRGLDGAVCIDTNEARLAFAGRELGAFCRAACGPGDAAGAVRSATDGRGADVCIVAAGSMAALGAAIGAARRGGTVVMFGVPSGGDGLRLDMADVYSREVSLRTTYAASDADTAEALRLLSSGAVPAGRLVTHRFGLDRAQEAFDLARSGGGGAVKIVVLGPAGAQGI